jgi:hypothetical protein
MQLPPVVHPTALASGRHAAEALARIREEFAMMPGLCLTASQAAQLLGLPMRDCEFLLGGLVVSGFLRPTKAGYVKAR